jgi:uncharacterized RDD family membrane protein YckC
VTHPDQSSSSQPIRTDVPVLDPFGDPARFEGLLWRRAFGYLVDLIVLAGLLAIYYFALLTLSVATLGLLTPALVLIGSLIPTAYHTLTIGGPRSATLGMRLMGIEVRIWNGGKPGYLQALLHTVVFYVTLGFTSGLILLWPLFSNRRRCLHDLLCGTLVVRRD